MILYQVEFDIDFLKCFRFCEDIEREHLSSQTVYLFIEFTQPPNKIQHAYSIKPAKSFQSKALA